MPKNDKDSMNVIFFGFCGIIKDYDRIMHVDSARVKEYYLSENVKSVEIFRPSDSSITSIIVKK